MPCINPATNLRTDTYGGSLKNRLRFLRARLRTALLARSSNLLSRWSATALRASHHLEQCHDVLVAITRVDPPLEPLDDVVREAGANAGVRGVLADPLEGGSPDSKGARRVLIVRRADYLGLSGFRNEIRQKFISLLLWKPLSHTIERCPTECGQSVG